MKPAVFLDRDGTINEQLGYINHISRFCLLPGVGKAIYLLNQNDYHVVVTSNQSGVAQGYFPVELVHEIHELMEQQLAKENAHLDGVYFCPHHPNGVVSSYKKECTCRKPNIGLIKRAESDLAIDMSRSYVIGDRLLDIEFADNAGLPGIMVLTGYGRGELEYVVPYRNTKPVFVAEDLLSAVIRLLEQSG